jgi:hypothetical protein|tara:strand:+ start:3532 stop:3795 length:264 start_codon:yes stop_codon:yes gene_type:complete
MPRRLSKKSILVNYKEDETVDAVIQLNGLKPKTGRGYRSVLYFEGRVKEAGMVGYVKLWRPVSKKKRKQIMDQFYKNMVAQKSPKII